MRIKGLNKGSEAKGLIRFRQVGATKVQFEGGEK
jgi:hypothetical protein